MNILGIETSCDETAAAVVQDGTKILSNVVVSQIDIFAEYGGVIPEVAARSHLEAILPVIHKALSDAHCDWSDIDAIAVTHTPGLLGSLLIGTLTARTLAILHNKPFYPVHHLKSHIYANWLEPAKASWRERPAEKKLVPEFPILALAISGGHTQIIYMKKHNHFQIIGTTRDDAVGECFDKVAKILGLPYPGGPAIAKAATGTFPSDLPALKNSKNLDPIKNSNSPQNPEQNPQHLTGDPHKYPFPHPQVTALDFSFSGLKTAVLRTVQKEVGKSIPFPSHELAPLLTPKQVADFAASFQKTAIDILLEKLQTATKNYPTQSLVFAGGVSANQALRQAAQAKFSNQLTAVKLSNQFPTTKSSDQLSSKTKQKPTAIKSANHPIFFPAPSLSGDNGAMVAAAAFFEIQSKVRPTDPYHLEIAPRSPIN